MQDKGPLRAHPRKRWGEYCGIVELARVEEADGHALDHRAGAGKKNVKS